MWIFLNFDFFKSLSIFYSVTKYSIIHIYKALSQKSTLLRELIIHIFLIIWGASGAIYSYLMWHLLTFPKVSLNILGKVKVPIAFISLGYVTTDLYRLYTRSNKDQNPGYLLSITNGILFYVLSRSSRIKRLYK